MIKVESFETRRKNAGVLHAVVGFYLIMKAFSFYSYSAFSNILSLLPVIIVAAGSLFYGLFRKRIDPSGNNNFWMRLLQIATLLVFGYIMTREGRPMDYYGLFVWALLMVLLLISERKIFSDTLVYFDENGITVPGDYKNRQLSWEEVDDVVVRHDFVTIFHRKKYLQYQVMQTLSELEVAKLNAFCREKVEPEGENVES